MEKNVFIIEYFKQLLIRRNSIKIMKDTEFRQCLHYRAGKAAVSATSLKFWPMMTESKWNLCVTLIQTRNRAFNSTTVERLFLCNLSVFLNSMLYLKTKTLNLCVTDRDASVVVEVDQAGQLRFRYTMFHYIAKKSFRLYGIITYIWF